MRSNRTIATLASLILATLCVAQTWTRTTTNGPSSATNPLLLTDGTVLVHNAMSRNWWKLTPSITGSYIQGTWTQMASMQSGYAPLYFAAAVLADGRVIIMGGEYNNGSAVWTNLGAVYDPVANVWTPQSAPSGWANIGDAQCCVLPNKKFALASPLDTRMALLDPVTMTWTSTGAGKTDRFDEEGWALLPEGTIVTVDAINAPACEKYIISTGVWQSAGSTALTLVDAGSQEMGPSVLLPNGTVLAMGGTAHNAVYTPGPTPTSTGSWAMVADFPNIGGQLRIADGPACLLPSGNVLCAASPGVFATPTKFLEWDGTNWLSRPLTPRAGSISCYQSCMLMLPTGQVLQTDQSNDVEIYTPTGSPNNAWRPTITACPTNITPGASFVISGTQFNGLSECSVYGDDASMATNYPIVRITNNATGHVFYCRTVNHSTMGVATGATIVSTNATAPAATENGVSTLEVVANGIASTGFAVTIGSAVASTLTEADVAGAIGQTVTQTATLTKTSDGTAIPGATVTFTVNGTSSGSGTTSAGGVATANYTIPESLGVGTKPMAANFAGNGSYSASNAAATLTVTKANTNLAVTNLSGAYGQTVTLSAILTRTTDSARLNAKTVSFTVDGVAAGSATTNTVGQATVSYTIPTSLSVGAHTIGASFAGDTLYNGTTGTGTLTVSKANTAIGAVASPSGTYGQAVTLTGTLTRTTDNAALSGKTLEFTVSGTNVGSATTNGSGVATLSYTVPESKVVGPHTLVVSFAGDTQYNSTSTNGTLTINKGNTATVAANATGAQGANVSLTATLTRTQDSSGLAGKTIAFSVDGGFVGNGTTSGSGLASFVYAIPIGMSVGGHSITTAFAGDSQYNASSDATKVLNVTPGTATVTGNVDLQFVFSPLGQTATIEFRTPSTLTVVYSAMITLDGAGNYSVSGVPFGTYDAAVKFPSWLRQVLPTVAVSGPTSGVNFSLLCGDAFTDNQVDLFDMNLIMSDFGAGAGDPADVNWDGIVDLFDLNIVFGTFGAVGDN